VKLLNRYLSAEIFFVHIGHGALFVGALVIVGVALPWWALFIAAPLVLFSLFGWAYEAPFVLPAATRLWRGTSNRAKANPTNNYAEDQNA